MSDGSRFIIDGQTFTLLITLGEVRRIKKAMGIDLTSDNDWEEIVRSTLVQIDLVWELVADSAKMTKDQFEESVIGSGVVDAISDALMQALSDFYRKLGKGKLALVTAEVRAGLIEERELTATPEFAATIKQMIHGAVSQNSRQSRALTGNR